MTLRAVLMLVAIAGLASCRDAAEAPPAAQLADDIELVTPRVSLGRTVAGGYATGTIAIRAKQRGAVLTQIEPTCGCTISHATLPVTLQPGQVFEAPVAMDLSRLPSLGLAKDGGPSTVERQIVIASQRGAKLTAMAGVEVSDRVRVQPPQVRFGTVAPTLQGTASFLVTAPEGAPRPAVVSVEPVPDVSAVVEPADDGATAVRVTWRPSAPGEMDAFLLVRLDDPREAEVRVRVQGRSEALVTVTPDRIENLAAPITQPIQALVTLRRVDEQPLRILGAHCTSHRVEVEVQPGEGPVRIVRLLVPVLPLPGEISGALIVRTDAPGAATVEVPIRVRAAS